MRPTSPITVVEDNNTRPGLQVIAAIRPEIGFFGFTPPRIQLCDRGSSRPRELPPQDRVDGAVTCTRLPQIVACGFPALRSSDIDSQHRN